MQNQLFYGDNLEVLEKHIGDETIDLCYVDPPFNSKRNYNQIYNNVGKDDIAQSQAFVDTWNWKYEAELYLSRLKTDAKYSRRLVETILGFEKILGKGAMLSYLVNMAVRFVEIWRVLKPSGSFYVHCDPTMSHYIKILLDSIFCDKKGDFQNEIIWGYRTGGTSKKRYARKHDVIFFYSKSKEWKFNLRYYKSWQNKRYNYNQKYPEYFDEYEQKWYHLAVCRDIWEDINPIGTEARERLGYSTQKPLALLERIITGASDEGDVVLDAFCGCGTTVDAAQSLNRKWIGIDITYNAVSLILKRLKDRYGDDVENQITLSGIPRDMESAIALAHKKDDRLRKEFEKWAIFTYTNNYGKINDRKGSDKGIDGAAYTACGTALFSVKSGNVSVKDIRDFKAVLEREQAAAGVFISLEPATKPMFQEAAMLGHLPNPPGLTLTQKIPKLQIVSIQEIMDGTKMNLPLAEKVFKSASEAKGKETKKLGL